MIDKLFTMKNALIAIVIVSTLEIFLNLYETFTLAQAVIHFGG